MRARKETKNIACDFIRRIKRGVMVAPFDVFKHEPDGSLCWCGAFPDLETAKTKVRELLKSSPGEYFIFSQSTGNKLYIKPDDT
jgi:hypothetical protein